MDILITSKINSIFRIEINYFVKYKKIKMIQIYHNGRCGKSREGLTILENSGKEFEIILYLDNVPSKKELQDIIKKLDISPIELVRQNEPVWKEKFRNLQLTDDDIIEAILSFPILMERPVVINGDKAVIGRPPEKIKAII